MNTSVSIRHQFHVLIPGAMGIHYQLKPDRNTLTLSFNFIFITLERKIQGNSQVSACAVMQRQMLNQKHISSHLSTRQYPEK